MKSTFLAVVTLLGVFAFSAAAADVSGKWTADVPGQNGSQQNTFQLKADGSTLTGSVTSPRGETPISEGKVDGDNISFVVVMKRGDQEMKIQYTGKVEGDTIKFKRERPGGQAPAAEFVAKKTTT